MRRIVAAAYVTAAARMSTHCVKWCGGDASKQGSKEGRRAPISRHAYSSHSLSMIVWPVSSSAVINYQPLSTMHTPMLVLLLLERPLMASAA